MSVEINDKDKGLEDIKKELKKFKKAVVKVGILSGSGNVDGVPIVSYATWNENGVVSKNGKWKIPPRPFIKGWVDNNKDKINSAIKGFYSKVSKGEGTCDDTLNRIGIFAKNGIQSYIRNGNFVENAEYTINKKGSSKPLIDTGAMRNAVNYEIEK